jgi:hypothetical protein
MAAHAATDASVQLLTEAAALLKHTLHPPPTLIANVHAELGRAFVTQSLRAAVGPWGGATTLNDATAAAAEAAAAGAARRSAHTEQWGPDGRRVPPPVPPLPVPPPPSGGCSGATLLGWGAEAAGALLCRWNAFVTPAAYVSESALVCNSAADMHAPPGTWRSS